MVDTKMHLQWHEHDSEQLQSIPHEAEEAEDVVAEESIRKLHR